MTIIAHITDVHLPPVPSPNFTDLSLKQMLGFLNWLRARQFDHQKHVLAAMTEDLITQKKDHILFSGDVVNLGLGEEFDYARSWMASLGGYEALSFVPGNHDYYSHKFSEERLKALAAYMKPDDMGRKLGGDCGPGLPFVRIIKDVAVIGVNSGIVTPPFRAYGLVHEAALERLTECLRRAKEAGFYRCVMIHHPPLVGLTKPHRALQNAADFQQIIRENGAELILFGHNHRQISQSFETIDGQCHVIGSPSFSMARDKKYDLARYNMFDISRQGSSWQTEMIGRGLLKQGGPVAEIERQKL